MSASLAGARGEHYGAITHLNSAGGGIGKASSLMMPTPETCSKEQKAERISLWGIQETHQLSVSPRRMALNAVCVHHLCQAIYERECTILTLRSRGRRGFLRRERRLMIKCNFCNSDAAVVTCKGSCCIWCEAGRETSIKYLAKMTKRTNMPWGEYSTQHETLPEEFIMLLCFRNHK